MCWPFDRRLRDCLLHLACWYSPCPCRAFPQVQHLTTWRDVHSISTTNRIDRKLTNSKIQEESCHSLQANPPTTQAEVILRIHLVNHFKYENKKREICKHFEQMFHLLRRTGGVFFSLEECPVCARHCEKQDSRNTVRIRCFSWMLHTSWYNLR